MEAAQELCDLLNFNDGRCLFLSSGSEAMEFAVQAAKIFAKKPHVLSLENYFLSSYGICKNKEHWIQLNIADIDETNIDKALDSIPFKDVGVFVFESGNASGTVRPPQKDIIKSIATRINSNDAIIVVDEVTTGMGRSGSWFGFEFYDLTPDFVVCGKGLGNGYPVSAVIMNNKMAVEFEKSNIIYAQSHMNDPLGCAIAKKVIEIIRRDNLIQKSMEMGDELLEGLSKLKNKHPCIKEIRGRGLMIAVEFHLDTINLEEIHKNLFVSGYIVGMHLLANSLRVYPPITINPSVIESFLTTLDNAL
jgi:acetylornithine aminotransferase